MMEKSKKVKVDDACLVFDLDGEPIILKKDEDFYMQ
jgi:hypothetical protein